MAPIIGWLGYKLLFICLTAYPSEQVMFEREKERFLDLKYSDKEFTKYH